MAWMHHGGTKNCNHILTGLPGLTHPLPFWPQDFFFFVCGLDLSGSEFLNFVFVLLWVYLAVVTYLQLTLFSIQYRRCYVGVRYCAYVQGLWNMSHSFGYCVCIVNSSQVQKNNLHLLNLLNQKKQYCKHMYFFFFCFCCVPVATLI